MKASFASHRLLVSRERWDRLRHLPAIPIFERAAKWLDELTDRWTRDFETPLDETVHNWHLIRARQAQTRVVSLLVQYGRTGDRRFREAAMEHLRRMAGWEYWSWITWRENEPDPNAIFDLSYGENSATLALAYDWLADELSPDERAWLLDTARTRALLPYLARTGVAGLQRRRRTAGARAGRCLPRKRARAGTGGRRHPALLRIHAGRRRLARGHRLLELRAPLRLLLPAQP
jgi:hypothetical protein